MSSLTTITKYAKKLAEIIKKRLDRPEVVNTGPISTNPRVTHRQLTLQESQGGHAGVDVGITVETGDFVNIFCTGRITPGGWLINHPVPGPDGDPNFIAHEKFPLEGEKAYGTIYKIVPSSQHPSSFPWQRLGTGISQQWTGEPGRLFLSINDDVPKNGEGSYTFDITITHAG